MKKELEEIFRIYKKEDPIKPIRMILEHIEKLENHAHEHSELFELHIVKKVLDKIAEYSKQLGDKNDRI